MTLKSCLFAENFVMTCKVIPRISVRSLQTIVVYILNAMLFIGCTPPAPDESGYLEKLLEDRIVKNQVFEEEDSPVPIDRRFWMLPLHYYEPDLTYRVPAKLNIGDDQPTFKIPTSTGQLRSMQRVGQLQFVLNGEPRALSAFVDLSLQETRRLFIPFRDETNKTETYPGGRYLDLDQTPTGIYDLDFNRAYNPYCYYNEDFDCPFPPPENMLSTDVRAGERLPPEDERPFPITVPELQMETIQENTSEN